MSERPRPYGPYVLLKRLATGGQGDVFLARPASAERSIPSPVVVKRLHVGAEDPELPRGVRPPLVEELTLRFRHEAQLAVAIDSPHVARIFDAGRVGESFYIAFEYIAGWPLSRIVQDVAKAEHRPTLRSVVDIVSGALLGLEALHGARHPQTGEALGIVHRDIAPKNIMVGEDGVTRLIDLGLGKSTLQDWKTGTGVVMGSPGYMAPEQVIAGTVDARTDTYAMGIVLWEMLTLTRYIKRGPVPLMLRAQMTPERAPPSTHRPDVPPALDAVVLRALETDPDARFESAAAFRAALLAAVDAGEDPPQVNTLVGDLLWGELTRAKTEVTALLDLPTSGPASATPEVEIVAQRPPAAMPPPPALEPPHVEYAPTRAVGTPTPTPYVIPLGSGPLPAQRGGVPPKMVAGLMLLMLALGIGVGAFVLDRRQALEAPVTIPTLEGAPAAPVAAPAPLPTVAPTPAPSLDEAPAEATEAPPPRRASRRPRRAAPAPTPPPAAAPDRAPTLEPNALLQRAMAVRGRLPSGSTEAEAAGRLITALQAEAGAARASGASPERLANLARQVRELERAAEASR